MFILCFRDPIVIVLIRLPNANFYQHFSLTMLVETEQQPVMQMYRNVRELVAFNYDVLTLHIYYCAYDQCSIRYSCLNRFLSVLFDYSRTAYLSIEFSSLTIRRSLVIVFVCPSVCVSSTLAFVFFPLSFLFCDSVSWVVFSLILRFFFSIKIMHSMVVLILL